MSPLIKEIKLPGEDYSFLNNNDSLENRILFLSKINIFVGENNSGKSRLLRSLLSNEFDYVPDSSFIENYNKVVDNLKNEFTSYYKKLGVSIEEINGVYPVLSRMNYIEYLNIDSNLKIFQELLTILENMKKQRDVFLGSKQVFEIAKDLLKIFNNETSVFGEGFAQNFKFPEYKKIYIPILRDMKPINYVSGQFKYDDVYRTRIRDDYFSDLPIDPYVFTGIQSNNLIKINLLGKLSQRKLVNDYQVYLTENFFDNKDVTLIPSEGSGVITVKIGDEIERPIYELGDGIQSIIILTLPLFINKGENLLIFIEEPEKLLHPGLQRKLIETFSRQEKGFENYQYFLTTHSNHLLDITFDHSGISIYTLRKKLCGESHDEKKSRFEIENLSHGDISALELLGVRNSSVFLSNCTIWVEGITDRLYFRHYLKLYFEHLKEEDTNFSEFKEDFHYSFVEYGGSNITHWSFLDKEENPINVDTLCGKLFLIVDQDFNKEERHKELEEKLGDRFYCLNCKEVENLLSKEVLLKVIRDYERGEPKIDFEESDYKDVSLGEFIDKILGDARRRKASYANGSTVRDKLSFCEKARKHSEKWEDLSEETKEICKLIYQFIKNNNYRVLPNQY